MAVELGLRRPPACCSASGCALMRLPRPASVGGQSRSAKCPFRTARRQPAGTLRLQLVTMRATWRRMEPMIDYAWSQKAEVRPKQGPPAFLWGSSLACGHHRPSSPVDTKPTSSPTLSSLPSRVHPRPRPLAEQPVAPAGRPGPAAPPGGAAPPTGRRTSSTSSTSSLPPTTIDPLGRKGSSRTQRPDVAVPVLVQQRG